MDRRLTDQSSKRTAASTTATNGRPGLDRSRVSGGAPPSSASPSTLLGASATTSSSAPPLELRVRGSAATADVERQARAALPAFARMVVGYQMRQRGETRK